MNKQSLAAHWLDRKILIQVLVDSLRKLSPRDQLKNPVVFVVYIASILTTALVVQSLTGHAETPAGFILKITLWLWFTVLFANFAEAIAQGRSKAQAAALRSAKRDVLAKKLAEPRFGASYNKVTGSSLRRGDVVLVEAGDCIPGDGEVIEGIATVDESAITGESAPVIRESGGDFSSVTERDPCGCYFQCADHRRADSSRPEGCILPRSRRRQAVAQRVKTLREADSGNQSPIPVDLVTASGSGLDPHISPAAAEYQANRVARTKNLAPEKVRALIALHTESRQFNLLGEPRVHVLGLNLALDDLP